VNVLAIVNKTGQRGMRTARAYALHGLWQLGLKEWSRQAPFYRLRHQLVSWNTQRVAASGVHAALNAQDISHIRLLIDQAQQQSLAPVSPTLLDQWFFQAVGAVRVQSQTGAATAWHLFEQSVHEQLGAPAWQRSLSLGLLVTLCAVWMTMVAPVQQPAAIAESPYEQAQLSEGSGTPDPVTISLLNLAYQKMQNGSCQLPQAAMLPDAQRQAFIMFVTKGKVDIEHVEQLRQALGYVSCLYPQELMHPQGRDRGERL
jgi:hypothetical protein